MLARRWRKELKWISWNATFIQRWLREMKVRRAINEIKQLESAIAMQKLVRGKIAKKAFIKQQEHKFRQQMQAVILIQNCHRGHSQKVKYCQIRAENEEKRLEAILRIQGHF
jgi:hypothetical protein